MAGPFNMRVLTCYEPPGDTAEDILSPTLPQYEWDTLGALADTAGTTPGKAALLCLARGNLRLDLPESRSIIAARQIVLNRDPETAPQLVWAYGVTSPPESPKPRRHFLRGVSPGDLGICARRSEGLGLTSASYVALAIMAGLFDAPIAPAHRRLIATQLHHFIRQLRKQADHVADIAKRATDAPVETFEISWAEIVRPEEE
jgi:hypothetical protein